MATKYIYISAPAGEGKTTQQVSTTGLTMKPQEGHLIPLKGELVLKYGNDIPRLKIGNGKDEFSALPYMSVDSFILPKPLSVVLYADNRSSRYTISGFFSQLKWRPTYYSRHQEELIDLMLMSTGIKLNMSYIVSCLKGSTIK